MLSKLRIALGLYPKNPLALIGSIVTLLSVIALIICLYYRFAGETASIRYGFGTALLFVGGFGLIPITFQVIYVLKCLRIQEIVAGNFWAHWHNPDVYFTRDGVYYPDLEYEISDFLYGLEKVEILKGPPRELEFSFLDKRYRSAIVSPTKTIKTIIVTIPPGKGDEARELVKRFQSELGKISRFMADQRRLSKMMGGGIVVFVVLWLILIGTRIDREYADEKEARNEVYKKARHDEDVAQITPMLVPIRKAIDSKIDYLKTLPNGQMTAEESGIDKKIPVRMVFYGHCLPDNSFYIYVVLRKPAPGPSYSGETGSFNYTTATDKNYVACGPDHYSSSRADPKLTGGWYYTEVSFTETIEPPRTIITETPAAEGPK